MIVLGILSVVVWKALLISSATVIVRAGGAIRLNSFAAVLFSMCSAVTVECCVLYPCCMCLVCLLLCREEGFSPVPVVWCCMDVPIVVAPTFLLFPAASVTHSKSIQESP